MSSAKRNDETREAADRKESLAERPTQQPDGRKRESDRKDPVQNGVVGQTLERRSEEGCQAEARPKGAGAEGR
jgi:hypothetical protein